MLPGINTIECKSVRVSLSSFPSMEAKCNVCWGPLHKPNENTSPYIREAHYTREPLLPAGNRATLSSKLGRFGLMRRFRLFMIYFMYKRYRSSGSKAQPILARPESPPGTGEPREATADVPQLSQIPAKRDTNDESSATPDKITMLARKRVDARSRAPKFGGGKMLQPIFGNNEESTCAKWAVAPQNY
jgi:hypothetical protein